MKCSRFLLLLILAACSEGTAPLTAARIPVGVTASVTATASRQEGFVTVAPSVRLQYIDFGGVGEPVLLLAGLGNTAHVFERFAPRLTKHFHVIGLTRRGFGASTIAAGATTLVAQTLLVPLAHAEGTSHVTFIGGTHVPHAPRQ